MCNYYRRIRIRKSTEIAKQSDRESEREDEGGDRGFEGVGE